MLISHLNLVHNVQHSFFFFGPISNNSKQTTHCRSTCENKSILHLPMARPRTLRAQEIRILTRIGLPR